VAEVAVERTTPAGSVAEAGPAIAVRGLVREYGELVALDRVSVELAPGETLAVLGPNGAGKTTLLRVLATLLRPTAGEVSVLGCELPRQAWKARGRIGYLGHEPLLYRDLTVAENLRFQARLHGLEGAEERIGELLAAVGLERRGGELARNLSAGMLQRAAICRAVLHRPVLLLLDEPRSHLDPDAARVVEPLLAGSGISRVLITHDVESGIADADRVLALRGDGTVGYEGPAGGISPGDARAIYGGRP